MQDGEPEGVVQAPLDDIPDEEQSLERQRAFQRPPVRCHLCGRHFRGFHRRDWLVYHVQRTHGLSVREFLLLVK